jgi:hypothetical protein
MINFSYETAFVSYEFGVDSHDAASVSLKTALPYLQRHASRAFTFGALHIFAFSATDKGVNGSQSQDHEKDIF